MDQSLNRSLRYLGIAAILFGALTVFSGGRALWGSAEVQAAMGQVVHWVLWFNFCAGFLYMLTGWGLWHTQGTWAIWCSVALAALTTFFALALVWHVVQGRGYEVRTAAAMAFRLGFWVWVAFIGLREVRKSQLQSPI